MNRSKNDRMRLSNYDCKDVVPCVCAFVCVNKHPALKITCFFHFQSIVSMPSPSTLSLGPSCCDIVKQFLTRAMSCVSVQCYSTYPGSGLLFAEKTVSKIVD